MIEEARKYLKPEDVNVIVYHKGCHDGQGAALCAWRMLGDGTNIFPINYIPMHYKDPILETDYFRKNVLVVDFSWPKEDLDRIRKVSNRVMILDHHKSAMEKLEGVEGCFFDMEESGASLAWKYFNPDKEEPAFIGCIKDRDIWAWEHRLLSEPMYYALRDLYWGEEFRKWSKYIDVKDNLTDLINHGRKIMEVNQKWIERQAKQAEKRTVNINGSSYQIMILELEGPKLVSEIAEYLYTRHEVDFTVCWFRHKSNLIPQWAEGWWAPISTLANWWYGVPKYILSFRTNHDHIDVSKIAGYFEGGGHAKAAGAQVSTLPTILFRETNA